MSSKANNRRCGRRGRENQEKANDGVKFLNIPYVTEISKAFFSDDDDEFFEDFIDDDTAYDNVDESQVWLDACKFRFILLT